MRLIADNGRKLGRYCVIGEPTDLSPINKHKGALTLAVELVGQSGHASDPSLGNNALDGMYVFMTELYAFRDRLQQAHVDPAFSIPTPTMNLGHIHGGDNSNRICGACTLMIDIRYLPSMSYAQLVDDIDQRSPPTSPARKLQLPVGPSATAVWMPTPPAKSRTCLSELTGKALGTVGFGTEAPYYNIDVDRNHRARSGLDRPGRIQPDEFLPIAPDRTDHSLLENLIGRFCRA